MSDKLPGTSYHNPIWFGKYRIYLGYGYTRDSRYEFAHDDYDGPEDNRAGHAASEADAINQIKDIEDDIIRAHFGEDPSDCEDCDGFGMVWNNADPTSGQWAACDCGDTRGHPF